MRSVLHRHKNLEMVFIKRFKEECRHGRIKAVTVSPQPTPAGTFNLKIENTTYVVGVHFSKTAKDTLEDKMKRLMLDDVKTANF